MTELQDADAFRRQHPNWPHVSPGEYPLTGCAHENKPCSPVVGDCLCECERCTARRTEHDDDWAGPGFGTRDVSGAVGADGLVYSDADPGL